MERKYMMYEGEDTNSIDLLYEKETEEKNGVKIIIPVKYADRTDFHNTIKEQLAYFESVYFDVCTDGAIINNDFVIYRGEDFQFSKLSTDGTLHICLDNVYYPVDFQKLGIPAMNVPVGLRFSLTDGLFPLPNRESLRYTKEAKDIILAKIAKVADFFVNKFNEQVVELKDVFQVFQYYKESSRFVTIAGNSLRFDGLISSSSVSIHPPKMKGVEHISTDRIYHLKEFYLGEYTNSFRLKNGVFRTLSRSWDTEMRINDVKSRTYYKFIKLNGVKKEYFRTLGKEIFFAKKKSSFKLFAVNPHSGKIDKTLTDYNTYNTMLELQKTPKSEWRAKIKEFQYILNTITNKWESVDDLVLPQSFLNSRKKTKVASYGGAKLIKLQGDVIGKEAKDLERYVDGKNCKWVGNVFKLENIHKMPWLVIYGTDAALMDKLYGIVDKKYIRFVQFSERELKVFEKINVHNWMPIEKFMKGENKPFKRLITAYLINKLSQDNRYVFEKTDQLGAISTDLSNKLGILDKYKNNNYRNSGDDIYKAMLEVAEANNLFDVEIYPLYMEIKKLLEKLPFINALCQHLPWYKSQTKTNITEAMTDLFKYHRQKINWQNYKIVLNEDVITSDLTEESVEELLED